MSLLGGGAEELLKLGGGEGGGAAGEVVAARCAARAARFEPALGFSAAGRRAAKGGAFGFERFEARVELPVRVEERLHRSEE